MLAIDKSFENPRNLEHAFSEAHSEWVILGADHEAVRQCYEVRSDGTGLGYGLGIATALPGVTPKALQVGTTGARACTRIGDRLTMLPPYTPQTKKEILEVQATVFLAAPDHFLQHAFLTPQEQRTLESSFWELRRGVDHVYRKPRHDEARPRMHDLLDRSYAEYKAGRIDEGRILIGEFENLIIDTKP